MAEPYRINPVQLALRLKADPPLCERLLVPEPEGPRLGWFGMTPLLRMLINGRPDLQQAFDTGTEAGLHQAIAWLYVHGLREYRLQELVDATTLAEFDRTPPFLYLPDAPISQNPDLTWLMYFVWLSGADLQRHFALDTVQGQNDFRDWFLFNGVANLGLAPLLNRRWRYWQGQPLRNTPGTVPLSRAALTLWKQRPALQRTFDLGQPAGWDGLARWALANREQDPGLRWLWEVPVEEQREQAARQKAEKQIAVASAEAAPLPFGLNLIGFAFGELGIGEDVRMAVAACEAAGIPFRVVNIHPGEGLRQEDRALASLVEAQAEAAEQAPYAINLFCLTGFDTARVFLERGDALFGGRYNIGWWPWELPVWPRDWFLVFDLVDEVWAATEFTRAMYEQALAARGVGQGALFHPPIIHMPLPVSVERVQPTTRQQLGLPEERFLFLYVFDFNSFLARKNPFAAVKAFRKAFPATDTGVGLVLKTMNGRQDDPQWQRFLRECAADPRIVVLTDTMDRGTVLGLIQVCDAYVSLHRSEGFGRTLAEAMLFGKPVLGTDFSGNVDFLNGESGFPVRWKRLPVAEGEYPYVTAADDPWWADPDIADAARQMHAARMAAREPGFGSRVQQVAGQRFAPARIGGLMQERLAQICRKGG